MESSPPPEQKTEQRVSEKISIKDHDKYVAAIESEMSALRSDLSSLVTQFAALQSLNYQDFVVMWQTLRMPEMIVIATGQRPNRELRTIMDEALAHSAAVFAESTDQQTKQYGGLYLMYSLYFVQPTIPKIKIRFTFEMWEKLKRLLEEAVTSEQWDAVYTGGTLIESNAFHFVCTIKPLIPEKAKTVNKSVTAAGAGAAASSSGGEKPAPTIDALLRRLAKDTNEFELAQSEYLQAKQALGSLRLPGLDRADAGIAGEIMAKIRRLADT